jgi:hypothetical protein
MSNEQRPEPNWRRLAIVLVLGVLGANTGADCQAVVVTVSQLLAVPHPETNAARLVGLLEYARLKGHPFEGGASGRGFGLRGQLNPSLGNPKHQRLVGKGLWTSWPASRLALR